MTKYICKFGTEGNSSINRKCRWDCHLFPVAGKIVWSHMACNLLIVVSLVAYCYTPSLLTYLLQLICISLRLSLTKSWTTAAAPNTFTPNFQWPDIDVASWWSIISHVLQVDGILDELVPLALCTVVLLDRYNHSPMQTHQGSLTQVAVTRRAVGQADKVVAWWTLHGTFRQTLQWHLGRVWTLSEPQHSAVHTYYQSAQNCDYIYFYINYDHEK